MLSKIIRIREKLYYLQQDLPHMTLLETYDKIQEIRNFCDDIIDREIDNEYKRVTHNETRKKDKQTVDHK